MMKNKNFQIIVLFLAEILFLSSSAQARRIKDSNKIELAAAVRIVGLLINDIKLNPKDFTAGISMNTEEMELMGYITNRVLKNPEYVAEFMLDYFRKLADLYEQDLPAFAEFLAKEEGLRGFLARDFKQSLTSKAGATGFRVFEDALYGFIDSLIENKVGKRDFSITIKSVCSSTGIEPYQIAMILHKKLTEYARKIGESPESWVSKWKVNIYAYDISMEALYKAKEGIYSRHEVELYYSEYKGYFSAVDDGNFQVVPVLRNWVKSTYLDLTSNPTSGIVSWHPAELVLFINPRAADLLPYLIGIRDYLKEFAFNADYQCLFVYGESMAGIRYEKLDF